MSCSSPIPAPRRSNARSRWRATITLAKGKPERYRIITFKGAFHGRTLGTIAAAAQANYLEGFGPPLDGFDQVPLGDLEAVKKAIGPQTAAILIEPVQGEGGVRCRAASFFKALRAALRRATACC